MGRSLRVKSHLRRLKYDLGELKQLFFFKNTEFWKDTDLKDAWVDFLEVDQIESLPQAVNVIPEAISQAESRESGPTSDMEEKAIESEGLPEPLFVGCEADSPSDEDDPLSVRHDVRAICAVLAARDVHLPLSLGLFGDWGTGKTYFMERMYERIDHLTKASQFKSLHQTAYCKNILQIRFNAWHFIDANPWAVMVTQILDEMYDYLSKDSRDSWQNAVKILEQDKGLFAEAKYTLQQVNNSVIAAERSLQSMQKAREQREMEVQRQFNSLKILLGVKAQIELRNEKYFLESMNLLLRTPRTLKKFVNTYRIFRARLTISSLDRLIGTESQPGEFQCAMVLLGIIAGFPTLASKAMQVLFQQDVQATWEDYMTNLKARPPREEDGLGQDMPASIQELQAEWNRMCEALANIYGGEPLPFLTSTFIKWASQLARYSFSIVPPHWQESMSTMKG